MTLATTVELESLWNHERARLVRYMRRRVGPEQAEDLVQELFLRAWSAIVRGVGYNEDSRGWCYKIAHNLAIDFYRARDRAPDFIELDADAADFADGGHGKGLVEYLTCDAMRPDELAMQSETVREVQTAIETLADDQRIVVQRRLDGYDFEEIAAEFDRSEGAIRSLQHRAFVNIKYALLTAPTKRTTLEAMALTPTDPPVTVRGGTLRDLLIEHGPLLVREMAILGCMSIKGVQKVIERDRLTFVKVGTVKRRAMQAYIWGIAGVHDTQKEAA